MSMALEVGGFWGGGLEDLDLSMSMESVSGGLFERERVDGAFPVSARAGRAERAWGQALLMSVSMALSEIGCTSFFFPTAALAGATARGAEDAALGLVRAGGRMRPTSGVGRRPFPVALSG